MKTPPIPPRSVSRALKMLAVLMAGMLSACGPDSDLKPGLPVEREIGGNESHTYRLPFEAGSFVSLRIEQPGINVKARLVDPGGESVPVFDDPGDREDPDRLAWIARTPGEYRLIVQARDPEMSRGLYAVEVQESRQSHSTDADRLTAIEEYAKGRRLFWAKEEKDRSKSLARFERALQLWTRSDDPMGQVDSLVQMMVYNNIHGKSDVAVKQGERALALARAAGYRAGEARVLHELANAYDRLDNPEAIDLFKKALERWQEIKDEGRQASALYSLGNTYYKQSQFDLAVASLERARSLRKVRSDVAVNILVALGNIKMDVGHTTQAIELCQQALELGRSSNSKRPQAVALHCLGAAYKQLGEFEKALRIAEESLKINLQLEAMEYQPTIRQALGSIYFNLGDTERTLLEYRRASEILQTLQNKKLYARLLTNTGFIYHAKGNPRQALWHYQKALPLNEEVEDISGIALTLHNTGVAYLALQKPQEGLSYLLRALALQTETKARSKQAVTLLEIGTAYRELGDFAQAVDYFRRTLDLAREMENTSLEAECLFRWASLDAMERRLPEALEKVKGALTIVESVRSGVTNEKLRTSFFASKRAYYELYVDLLMKLEELHPGKYQEAALEISERARARGLLELLAEGHIHLQQGIDQELRQQEVELEARVATLQGNFERISTAEASAFWERQLEEARTERVGLESKIRSEHRHYAEIRYPTPLKAAEIQGLLDDNRTALVQYFTGQQASYLFVVTRESIESYRLPSRDELTREVTKLREMLQKRMGRRDLNLYRTLASKLYQELLGPAESSLRDKSHLLIAPDGPLYLLPFEALLVNGEGARPREFKELPYLLRRFAVSYIPSASVLRGLRSPRPSPNGTRSAAKQFLGFADPRYGGGEPSGGEVVRGRGRAVGAEGLVRLADSKKEVERIAGLYPRNAVALYVGEDATEENLKNNKWLDHSRQIHLATHGTVNESQPLLSGLELARTAGSKEDGTLRVDEIFNLRLNADLVTLSACKTALGQQVSGEGVVGMTRAFFYAGAKSLVVSLWPVSDRSTPDLMFDFYRNLGASQKKAEALRRAKLAMIESESYAEPYFWAPFILSGDPK